MANKKIFADLTELTTAAADDVLAIVDDITGTPTTKKISVSNLMAQAPVQTADIANMVETTDSINVLSDVDTVTTSPTTDDLLKWDGSNFVPGTVTVDVDTPLTTALRGTDNPHIGAFPQQSFKVMDNPNKSAMVIADADGNVTYVLKDTTSQVKVKAGSNAPSRFALASDLPAFVLENDSGEPDIEVTEPNTGKKISVISGDGDEKGANNLPTIQGYITDIGGNPAPLLISGGTIA